MSRQSEYEVEYLFIERLESIGYQYVELMDVACKGKGTAVVL